MKALRTLTILFALALMCLPAPSAAAAEKPFKLDICAMPEHESFIFWYAKEQGWDKDEGLDFQIHFFQTGMDQLEALPAKQWVVGGTGTVPILVGALRYNTYLIGIANDYVAEGKTSVDWCFSTMPSEEWKNGVGSALTAYAAGTGDWNGVVTAFVDGWAKEYKLANG